MKYLTKMAVLSVSVLAMSSLTACQSLKHKISDNSLEYQKAVKLDPVQLPADSQTHVFTPIYQVPNHVGENTLELQNQTGKRFELPKPISTVK